MKHLLTAFLTFVSLQLGSCSDSNFSSQVKAPTPGAGSQPEAMEAVVSNIQESDMHAERVNGEPSDAEQPVDVDVAEDVSIPQAITGGFLVRCASEGQVKKMSCRLEAKSDSSKADFADIEWEVHDTEGRMLNGSEYSIRKLGSESFWHSEIDVMTDRDLRIVARSQALSASDGDNQVAPFIYKSAASEPEQPEAEQVPVVEQVPVLEQVPVAPKKQMILSENFSTTNSWTVWQSHGALDFSSSSMKCVVPANTSEYSGITSKQSYNFFGGIAELRIVSASAPEDGMQQALWGITDGSSKRAMFMIQGGSIHAKMRDEAGLDVTTRLKTYDPLVDRYLRIQHSEATGQLSFERSSDGITWSTLLGYVPSWSLAAVRFELECGAWRWSGESRSEIDDLLFYKMSAP